MGGDVDAKNGDVEIAWDSSEVGADTETEYVPLMREEHPSLPSPQPNIVPLNQLTIEGIPVRDPVVYVWKLSEYWIATWIVLWITGSIFIKDENDPGGAWGTNVFFLFPLLLLPVGTCVFWWVTWVKQIPFDREKEPVKYWLFGFGEALLVILPIVGFFASLQPILDDAPDD